MDTWPLLTSKEGFTDSGQQFSDFPIPNVSKGLSSTFANSRWLWKKNIGRIMLNLLPQATFSARNTSHLPLSPFIFQ